jgi:CHRD domain
MKTQLMVAAAILGAAASGAMADGKDRIRARLTGYQEVPLAVSTPASGRFVADVARNGESFDYELTYGRLLGTITQSHIHFNQRGLNGPIIIWLCQTATNPAPATVPAPPQCPLNTVGSPTMHSVTGTITAASVLAAAAQQLSAGELAEALAAMRAGAAYVNVHTSVVPGGEIRGQTRGRGMRKEDENDGHDGDHKH